MNEDFDINKIFDTEAFEEEMKINLNENEELIDIKTILEQFEKDQLSIINEN